MLGGERGGAENLEERFGKTVPNGGFVQVGAHRVVEVKPQQTRGMDDRFETINSLGASGLTCRFTHPVGL